MKKAFGLPIPTSLEEICTPDRCSLVIYDMQAGIVPQIAEGKQIVAQCQKILTAARAAGFRIFYLRHFFLPTVAAGVGQLRRAMVWQGKDDPTETQPFITQSSPGFQIVPELSPAEGEVVVDKITMSAFAGTFLDIAMRDAHLDSFLIAGIALEIGIEPTVRHALDLNYMPVVIADACGSKNEELKAHSLATLSETGEVFLSSTDQIIEFLKRV